MTCTRCHQIRWKQGPRSAMWAILPEDNFRTINDSIKATLAGRNHRLCPNCQAPVTLSSHVLPDRVPVFCIQNGGLKRDCTATVTLAGKRYALRGVVYGGGNHFTARIITRQQEVYRYDGIQQRAARHEGHFRNKKEDIWTLDDKRAIAYIYCST